MVDDVFLVALHRPVGGGIFIDALSGGILSVVIAFHCTYR
jgi:hypothetical protein